MQFVCGIMRSQNLLRRCMPHSFSFVAEILAAGSALTETPSAAAAAAAAARAARNEQHGQQLLSQVKRALSSKGVLGMLHGKL